MWAVEGLALTVSATAEAAGALVLSPLARRFWQWRAAEAEAALPLPPLRAQLLAQGASPMAPGYALEALVARSLEAVPALALQRVWVLLALALLSIRAQGLGGVGATRARCKLRQ